MGELFLHDLMFIEKRLERLEKDLKKKNDKKVLSEQNVMQQFKNHLEEDKPLSSIEISEEDEKLILSYPFLTRKKILILLNVDDVQSANGLVEKIKNAFAHLQAFVVPVSAQMELEIAVLETEEEKKEFMSEMGITETALNGLSKAAMTSLGLMSFFTVGSDEVKQWLVRIGSSAPVAAGVIHSDIQRGFIRAEVMKYDDLIDLGSEDEVKKAGKFYIMGKDYIVEDADIISFRFNV